MGVLDDLRTQAQGQREQEESDAAEAARREQFYRDEIQPRMTKAYQYFMELVEHLNYVNLDTPVEYPLWPEGKPETLHQGEYMVVIDSSQAVKRIDVTFQGKLDKPLEFEIRGREAVLRHADRLDRYHIKYERRYHKDTNLDLIGGDFKIEGPLPLKIVIHADVLNSVIQLVFRNFSDPGVSRYSVQPKEFDDAFLDRLGQFMLRKVDKLFTLAIDDDARNALRRKLQEEQVLRDQEMREAEERWQAEEAERLANSTKEQIKNTLLKAVGENKERLKGIFDKLKKPTQAPQQTPPVQSTPQTIPPASKPQTKPAQPHQQVAAKKGMSAQINPPTTVIPPVSKPKAEQVREPAAPAKRQIPQPRTARAPTQAPSVSPANLNTAAEPVGVANSKAARPPSTTAVQTATVKKATPPKVYNAPPNNPFLKPESPAAPPAGTAEPEAKTAAEKLNTSSKRVPPEPESTRAGQVREPAATAKRQIPQPRTAKAPTQAPSVSPANLKTAAEPAGVANSKLDRPSSTPAVQTTTVKKTTPPKVQNAAASNNPFLKPESPVTPAKGAAEPDAKTVAEPPEVEATPMTDFASRQDLTPESLEEDLARIIERDKQNTPQQTPESNKTTNPFLQTPSTKVAEQTTMPPDAIEPPRGYLKSGELNTSLSDVMPITRQDGSTKDAATPAAKNSTQNPFLKPEELDIDISDNVVVPQNNDSKENS